MPKPIKLFCPAETPIELWDLDAAQSGKDVRCARPKGHDGAHQGVITWTDAKRTDAKRTDAK